MSETDEIKSGLDNLMSFCLKSKSEKISQDIAVFECMLSICEALYPIPSTSKHKMK